MAVYGVYSAGLGLVEAVGGECLVHVADGLLQAGGNPAVGIGEFQRLAAILPLVEKPGRYTGGELNSVVKDWASVSTRVCLAFPEIYDIGMSNLGLAILYDLLNQRSNVLAERAYVPWLDMEEVMRREGLPLYSLETKHPVAAFDILGLSLRADHGLGPYGRHGLDQLGFGVFGPNGALPLHLTELAHARAVSPTRRRTQRTRGCSIGTAAG